MSQLNSLLESANPYKSLQSDAARLANKWNKTGLLEGIGNETEKNNMSIILENQAKQLVMEEVILVVVQVQEHLLLEQVLNGLV